MTKRIFDKLVRDKIPEICIAEDQQPDFYEIIDDQEFLAHLINKLREEVEEMIQAPSIEEAADILEVLLTIGKLQGFGEKDLQQAAEKKREAKGGFQRKFFLHSIQEKMTKT